MYGLTEEDLDIQKRARIFADELIPHEEAAELAGGELPAGPHAVTWNGRDGSGALASSGVYVVRTHAGRDVGVGKLVLHR